MTVNEKPDSVFCFVLYCFYEKIFIQKMRLKTVNL